MADKEELILKLIKENPYITQQEIAERLSLSRSRVAGYISGLIKTGKIIGRAYIVNDSERVLCVGGANVDRKASVKTSFKWGDSNPVTFTETSGGVARNIAENLGRLQVPVSILTAIGEDAASKKISSELSQFADVSPSVKVQGERAGTYTAVLDSTGEMLFALADMEIYDSITSDTLKDKLIHLRTASLAILDTNFPKEVLTAIIDERKAVNALTAVVPVSAKKVDRLPDDLTGIDYLICNKEELETICRQYSIVSGNGLFSDMEQLIDLGIKNLVVTAGKDGVTFLTSDGEKGTLKALAAEVKDVTGAGDAFSSGFFYGIFTGLGIEQSCRYGLAGAALALETNETVFQDLSADKLRERAEKAGE